MEYVRAEESPFAYEDSDRDVVTRVNFSQALRQMVETVFGQSVQLLWPIELDDGNAPTDLDVDPLLWRRSFCHGGSNCGMQYTVNDVDSLSYDLSAHLQ